MKNSNELTKQEKTAVQSVTNPSIRRFVSTDIEQLGHRTGAFQKIARAANAERRAIEETVLLELVKEGIPNYEGLRGQVSELSSERDRLQAEKESLYKRLGQTTAQSALVENASGTAR